LNSSITSQGRKQNEADNIESYPLHATFFFGLFFYPEEGGGIFLEASQTFNGMHGM
jgi:hypothetical protein